MKNIFIESHKMTREFKEKYNVDYQFQFGLFVKNNFKSDQVIITGTKRLVRWANQIRNEMLSNINDLDIKNKLNKIEDAEFFIDNRDLDIENLIISINSY